jgi:hypothetical protein
MISVLVWRVSALSHFSSYAKATEDGSIFHNVKIPNFTIYNIYSKNITIF